MLDAIDAAPAGSVYVMVLENGLDYGGIGALMVHRHEVPRPDRSDSGWLHTRHAANRQAWQFPVFSRGVAPSTTIGHYRFAGVNVPGLAPACG